MSGDKSTSEQVRQFTVGADDEGVRLDRWFKRHLPQIGFATVSRLGQSTASCEEIFFGAGLNDELGHLRPFNAVQSSSKRSSTSS